MFAIQYKIIFSHGNSQIFHVELDESNCLQVKEPPETIPDWAELDCHKCHHCPLSSEEHRYCPVAVNLVDIVQAFGDVISHEKVDVEIWQRNRTVRVEGVMVQNVLSSLMGLVIATSACPYTLFLRPLAFFHQPLADMDESVFRLTSSYLMSQFLLNKNTANHNQGLEELDRFLDQISDVNAYLAKRLSLTCKKDSSINSLVKLDARAKIFSTMARESLEKFRKLFSAPHSSDA